MKDETATQKKRRLEKGRERRQQKRALETEKAKEDRLAKRKCLNASKFNDEIETRRQQDASRRSAARANETENEHEQRLQILRQTYAEKSADVAQFEKTINMFCDKMCDVCNKQ